MKKEEKKRREEAQKELKGIDLEIAQAEARVKKAEQVFKSYPNRESFAELSRLRAEVKKLQEEKAKQEGKWNPTSWMPWRTEVKSRLYIGTIRRRIEKLGLKIDNENPKRIVLRGKQCGVLLKDLTDCGLTEDEDFEIRTWQMTLETAREFYRKENEKFLEEQAEKEAKAKMRKEELRKEAEEWSKLSDSEKKSRTANIHTSPYNVKIYQEMGCRHSEHTVRV